MADETPIKNEWENRPVVDLADYRVNWRPIKEACFWCGYACIAIVSEGMTRFTRGECAGCGLFAATLTHEPPEGWQRMDEDELRDAGWVPIT